MSTIQIKRGTGSAVPSGLADGELAINLDSRQLYFGSSSVSVSDFKINNLTVNELTSSIVTSSIIFSSGSNIFGDASSDTQGSQSLFEGFQRKTKVQNMKTRRKARYRSSHAS